MLVQCWATVYDVGPTLNQHSVNASCLLGNCTSASATTALGTRLCHDVESTSMTLIQRRNNVVCQAGKYTRGAL